MKKLIVLLMVVSITSARIVSAQNQPPVALPDTFNVISQVPTLLDVLANDYDPDGDSIWIVGAYDIYTYIQIDVVEGKLLYPAPYYMPYSSILYEITDEYDAHSYAFVEINTLQNPDAPVAVSDTFDLVQMQSYQLDFLANDYDPNGDSFKIFHFHTQSQFSCASLSADSLSIIITPSIFALERVYYQLVEIGTEENYVSNHAVVVIRNSDSPIVVPDTADAIGGIPLNIPVTANDFDPQDEEFRIYKVDVVHDGDNAVIVDSIVRFTSAYSFSGQSYFRYRLVEIDDPTIYSDYCFVRVNVLKNPDCPVAVNDTAYGLKLEPLIIDVLSNDYDRENEEIEIMSVDGICEITDDNKILYKPGLYPDSTELIYRIREVNDPKSFSDDAVIKIYLANNPNAPVSVSDHVTAVAGIPVKIAPLENDILNSADTLILSTSDYNYGEMGMYHDSSNFIIYTPAYQAEGVDSIYYTALNEYGIPCLYGKIFIEISSHKFTNVLTVNNIRPKVNANGHLFNTRYDVPESGLMFSKSSYYRFPASDSSNSTIYYSGLWINGGNNHNQLHLAAETFKRGDMVFIAGPVSDVYDQQHYSDYGRVWKLNSDEIDYHRQNFGNAGYTPVDAIATWPGNGDTTLGQAASLAPFADLSNDGVYRWQDGDYPLIRGDQAIFFIYNDDTPDNATGVNMKVEIHGMVYGFNDPSDTALFNTVLVHYDIINRSENIYYDTYFSIFADIDLGCAYNDIIGCDVNRGSYYSYNISDIDCDDRPYNYGNNTPAQSVTILAGPYLDSDGLDNNQGGCDESINGFNFSNQIADDERYGLSSFSYFVGGQAPSYMRDPKDPKSHYFYMTGRWLDGKQFLYGGDGHPSGGALGPESRFLFPGNSDPLNWGTSCDFPEGGYNQGNKFWTEEESGGTPSDKRGLGNMGPFTFKPGDVQEVDVAYCTGLGNNGTSSLTQLFKNIDSVRTAVKAGKILIPNDVLGNNPEKPSEKLLIYPNPAGDFIAIKGLQDTYYSYSIYNLLGIKIMEGLNLRSTDKVIKIKSLPRGAYIIKLTTGIEQKAMKFIKN